MTAKEWLAAHQKPEGEKERQTTLSRTVAKHWLNMLTKNRHKKQEKEEKQDQATSLAPTPTSINPTATATK